VTWLGVQGHDQVVDRFRRALANNRLASSFLFVGPAGVGKRMFAERLAQTFLCSTRPEALLDPCGECPDCKQVLAGAHPDLEFVEKPRDKTVLPLELFIGDDQNRMKKGLCHAISLKPMRGRRKVAIIDDADLFNQESANSLLKTLEEPPPNSVLILIGTSEQKQLPTIRSRCQIVRFGPLSIELTTQLLQQEEEITEAQANEAASLSGGSLTLARTMLDEELRGFRHLLYDRLASGDLRGDGFAKTLIGFIDSAGAAANLRRKRMRQVFDMAAEFYRELIRLLVGAEVTTDTHLGQATQTAAERWKFAEEAAAISLERCLDAERHVLANANQNGLLESWVDDLSSIAQTGAAATPFVA